MNLSHSDANGQVEHSVTKGMRFALFAGQTQRFQVKLDPRLMDAQQVC